MPLKIHFRIPHVLYLWAILSTTSLFSEFIVADPDAPVLKKYLYLVLAITLWVTARNLDYLRDGMRRWWLVVIGAIVALALESYGGWGRWFVYPHVFSKLTDLLSIFGVYAYYKHYGVPRLGLLIGWVPILVGLNLLVLHPETFGLRSFIEQERGVNAAAAFLLILPLIYYFNCYLQQGKLLLLLAFLATLVLIIFLQHRTVWVASSILLALNYILSFRTTNIRLTVKRLVPMLVIPILLVLVGGLSLVLHNPDVVRKLSHNMEDIRNPDKQGTGNWRLNQYEAYKHFLQEYPIAGMRLKGFELPVQFYDNTGEQVWANGTGHHFHSFYVDRLFYYGWLGLLLVLAPPILFVYKRLRRPEPLTLENLTLLVFACGGLIYGVSYTWPDYFYGLLGLTMSSLILPDSVPVKPALKAPVLAPTPISSPTPIPTALLHG